LNESENSWFAPHDSTPSSSPSVITQRNRKITEKINPEELWQHL